MISGNGLPVFRSRGPGNNGPPMFRGRGNGPFGSRFPGPNFENWGLPGGNQLNNNNFSDNFAPQHLVLNYFHFFFKL